MNYNTVNCSLLSALTRRPGSPGCPCHGDSGARAGRERASRLSGGPVATKPRHLLRLSAPFSSASPSTGRDLRRLADRVFRTAVRFTGLQPPRQRDRRSRRRPTPMLARGSPPCTTPLETGRTPAPTPSGPKNKCGSEVLPGVENRPCWLGEPRLPRLHSVPLAPRITAWIGIGIGPSPCEKPLQSRDCLRSTSS